MTVSQGGSSEDVKLQQLRESARIHNASLMPTKPMPPSHPNQPPSSQQQPGNQAQGAGRRSDAVPLITTTGADSRGPLTGTSTATSSTTASTTSMNLVRDTGPVRGSSASLHPTKPSNSQSGSFRRRRRNSKTSPDHAPSCASSLKNSQLLAEPVKFMMGGGGDESGDEADQGSALSPISNDPSRMSPTHSSQSISHNSNVSPAPPSTQQSPATRLHHRRSFRGAHRNSFTGDSFSAAIPEHSGEREPVNVPYNNNDSGGGDDDDLSDGSLVFGFGTLLDEPRASRDNGCSPASVTYETAGANTSPRAHAGSMRAADRRGSNGALSATPTQYSGPAAAGSEDPDDDPIMRRLHTDDPDPNQRPVPKKPLDLHAALPDYTLKKTLGEGAFAKVKQAVHKASGISVAIKIIFKDSITADYVRDNLHREGELLRQLNHPHIIKLFEIVETDDIYCLVTELATGGEVLDYIVAHGSLSEKEVRKYCRQMIQAIDHLHQTDIVHRDLKTENLLLDHSLNLKLVDFGLSNSIKGKTSLTTMCGSPAYTAPELLGGKQYGKPVDIWSIGVNMYAMLTGKLPFSSHNVTTLHAMILDQQYTIPDKISEECKDLLTKLLVAKPKDRIRMEDLRNHPWLAQSEGPIPADPGPAGRKLEINSDIVDHMVSLGHDREEVLEAIETNCCNAHYACYHLLAVRLERTGHLSVRAPSATRGRLTRAQTDVNLKALNSSKNTLEGTRTGRSPHRVGSGRRKSLSGLRPPRPKHSRTRGSRSPQHRPHAEPAPSRFGDTKKPADGGGKPTTNPAGTAPVATPTTTTATTTTTTPARPFHRSLSSTDALTRRRPSFRRASTDQPPVLAEVDKEEEGGARGSEEPPPRRHRTTSTRVYRKSFTLDESLAHESSTDATTNGPADGSPGSKHGGGGGGASKTMANSYARTNASGAAGTGSTGAQGRRATLHTTNRKALLKSLCRAHDDPPTPSSGQAPSTVTPEELSADLNATLTPVAGARRRSSVGRRSFRNGSNGPSLPTSTTGSSKDILPDIPTGVHPSQKRPVSSTAPTTSRVRSASLRRRSGERRPSTSSNSHPEPTIQSIRYPLNRRMVSAKSPSEIYEELRRALTDLDIQYRTSPDTPMGVVCRYKNVRLEAEIVKVAGLSMHGVHMQRQRGDLETYAEICTTILDQMNL